MRDWQIRPAEVTDLAAAFDIYYAYEFAGEPRPTTVHVPAYLEHVRETGRLLVAEQAGGVIGFAGLVTRDGVSFLTDFFMRPAGQSGAVGKALLAAVLPTEGVRCTCSTADPRALALYIRAGMRPVWPQFLLRGDQISPLDTGHGITIDEARSAEADRALIAWETEIGGRDRAQDLAFWRKSQDSTVLWFSRDNQRLGYAVIRLGRGTVLDPEAITIGPLGVRNAADAIACTLAAVEWARLHAERFYLTIPGPHPALAILLQAGCRIEEFYTFVASDEGAFADPHRYISSGADLF